MKRLLAVINIAATLAASSASAFDPAHLKRLKDTGDCINCDLKGADLRGADLKGAKLMGAKLSGANLDGAKLDYAIMDGAIFCNTTMPDGSVLYTGC